MRSLYQWNFYVHTRDPNTSGRFHPHVVYLRRSESHSTTTISKVSLIPGSLQDYHSPLQSAYNFSNLPSSSIDNILHQYDTSSPLVIYTYLGLGFGIAIDLNLAPFAPPSTTIFRVKTQISSFCSRHFASRRMLFIADVHRLYLPALHICDLLGAVVIGMEHHTRNTR
jgi:hypothetical protein